MTRVIVCLLASCLLALPAHAAAPERLTKERLVLMPLRVDEADKTRQSAMESALVQGLQQK